MRSLFYTSCVLLGLAMGCSPAAEPRAASGPVGEQVSEAAAEVAKVAEVPAATETFASLLTRYPLQSLPRDYAFDDKNSIRTLEKRPLSEAQAAWLVGPEKIEISAGDKAFALERIALQGDVSGLITFFKGDSAQEMVLSTHMPDGTLISHVQVAMRSRGLSYGYSSSLSIHQHLSRAMMITNDAGQPDVDSFDDFVIESDGRISMTEQ